MGFSGPPQDVTIEDIRGFFSNTEQPSTPFFTEEVAEALECPRQTARHYLEDLAEQGEIQTKQGKDSRRVWWTDNRSLSGDNKPNEEQLQAFVSAVKDYAIFMLNPDGRIASWNQGAERIKGYSDDEIGGEHFSTFYTDDDVADGVPEYNLETAAAEGRVEDEGWRVRKDGSRFWANVTITAIRDDEGTLLGFTKVTRDMTERREYEQQLEDQAELLERQRDELERELNDIFDHIDEAFLRLDTNWHITYVNDHTTELVRLPAEELVDSRVWDVLPEVVEGRPRELAEEAMQRQESVEFEFFSELLDIWIEIRGYPSESGMSVYFRDISERKEREQELQRVHERMEFALDATDAIVWDWNVDEDQASFYPSAESLYGSSVENWDDFVDVIHPEDRQKVREGITNALETGEPKHEEIRILGDGEVRWIEAPGYPVQDDDGSTRVVGVARDITEQKERERELEKSNRQQAGVSDLGQNALEEPDLDELFHEASRLIADVLDNDYCKVLDLDDDAEELLLRQGVGWQDGIVGNATISAVEADSQASYTLQTEEPIVVTDLDTETRFSGPDLLTSHDVRSGISTIIGSREDPWGILGTHDTDRKEFTDEDVQFVQNVANILAEAIERRRYRDELEELIGELKESNERLEQFAYVASHDLQEPLRMISSYLQLVEDRYADQLNEDGQEFIEFAVDGAERMREMINDLLAYSRVHTEAEPLEPTESKEVVERALSNLQLQIEENNATIDIEPLPTVTADDNQLEQVFQNLVSNAIKYRGEEPPEIEIGADRRGNLWEFWVADNGIGMETGETKRIFNVFDRLHSRDEYPGTGIGLALCKKIVDRHGGDIWVDSEPGKGSTFYFTIPTASDQE